MSSASSCAPQRGWTPAPGVQIEALLTDHLRIGLTSFKCWKGGTVTSTAVIHGHQCAEVRPPVVGAHNFDNFSSIVSVCILTSSLSSCRHQHKAAILCWGSVSASAVHQRSSSRKYNGTGPLSLKQHVEHFLLAGQSEHHLHLWVRRLEATCT